MYGNRFSSAISIPRRLFVTDDGFIAPPFTVMSLPLMKHSTDPTDCVDPFRRRPDRRYPGGQRVQFQ